MTGGGKEYRLPLPGWIIEKVFSVVDLRETIERRGKNYNNPHRLFLSRLVSRSVFSLFLAQ